MTLDAWGQRENEHPPVESEKKQWITITLSFEWSSYNDHPSDWNWSKLLEEAITSEVIIDEYKDE
tara:strand:- start:9186 stop:9380 length:195 start_codon:yes stop_codon:yes gene_type:complete